MQGLKARAKQLKLHLSALTIAYRDSRTPWYVKFFVAGIVVYALSPIDLIPDFLPVVGYLDDLILLPLAIVIAIRLIPPDVMADAVKAAQSVIEEDQPVRWSSAIIVVFIWLVLLAALLFPAVKIF
ncbi:MAG TPA: YkvA family protein [Aggregatilineales bacterium]|nr:YkvA family protein [Aggregatilineales bacterium]